MRRIGAACAALLLCILLAVPCFAASENAETRTIDVYARYSRAVDEYTASVENGKAAVTLGDGTRVTVSGIPENGLRLVVYPIPEADGDAWRWFESCMAGYGTNIYPLDIYFVDQNGARAEVGQTITVTIEALENYENPFICYISTEGSVTVMDSSVNGNQITFRTNHNSYYVLTEQQEASTEPTTPGDSTEPTTTPTPGDSTEPTTTTTPGTGADNEGTGNGTGGNSTTQATAVKTGDETDLTLWILLCGGAAMILLVCAASKLKMKKREQIR